MRTGIFDSTEIDVLLSDHCLLLSTAAYRAVTPGRKSRFGPALPQHGYGRGLPLMVNGWLKPPGRAPRKPRQMRKIPRPRPIGSGGHLLDYPDDAGTGNKQAGAAKPRTAPQAPPHFCSTSGFL